LVTIGRYEVEGELGVGGMAVVYLARDPYMERQVAIKLLNFQYTSDKVYQTYFQREAKVIATLEHPAIVPVYDYGLHGTQPYIVMRHLDGGTLKERIEGGKGLELGQLAHIVGRVADGLDAAHGLNVIHRDVKPSNILFDASGEAYLADFGIAKISRQSTRDSGSVVLGTPAYMSPEQVSNSDLDGRSDVYALGCTLYHVLTGRPPYMEPSPIVTAMAHLTKPVPKVLELRPDLRPPWEEIISKVLAKEPADRYATAGDLARDVEQVASGRWYLRKLKFDS
jgi:serine/threonine-protein kinase